MIIFLATIPLYGSLGFDYHLLQFVTAAGEWEVALGGVVGMRRAVWGGVCLYQGHSHRLFRFHDVHELSGVFVVGVGGVFIGGVGCGVDGYRIWCFSRDYLGG